MSDYPQEAMQSLSAFLKGKTIAKVKFGGRGTTTTSIDITFTDGTRADFLALQGELFWGERTAEQVEWEKQNET